MVSSLKQFVPSSVCLQCEGCCRFHTADSPWRPRMGAAEKAALSALLNEAQVTDEAGFVKAVRDCGNHLCQFFQKGDSTCKVYDTRPFECALYPFLLSKVPQGVKVYVHLACPYAQDHQADVKTKVYVDYLKGFFNAPQTRKFLLANRALAHDYTPFEEELQYLFTIQGFVL